MSNVVPPEWSPHRAMWLGFPSHAELWEADLEAAQDEVAALARALAGPGGEAVRLMVCGEAAMAAATMARATARARRSQEGLDVMASSLIACSLPRRMSL